MWLADSSVWIDHFRTARPDLYQRLSDGHIFTHPCVLGELSCGNLAFRTDVLGYLAALPHAVEAMNHEVLFLIEDKRLYGKGIGWVDAQLLAAALLTGCRLWTLDKKLAASGQALGVC